MTGTVGFYYDDKGYGFIETDELERSVFAHISKVIMPVPPALCKNQLVEFDLAENTQGYVALNIKPFKHEEVLANA